MRHYLFAAVIAATSSLSEGHFALGQEKVPAAAVWSERLREDPSRLFGLGRPTTSPRTEEKAPQGGGANCKWDPKRAPWAIFHCCPVRGSDLVS